MKNFYSILKICAEMLGFLLGTKSKALAAKARAE